MYFLELLVKLLGFILQGHVPPAAHLSSMWKLLLMNLLRYLPAANPLLGDTEDDPNQVSSANHILGKIVYLFITKLCVGSI